jgi:hypothetical protein
VVLDRVPDQRDLRGRRYRHQAQRRTDVPGLARPYPSIG